MEKRIFFYPQIRINNEWKYPIDCTHYNTYHDAMEHAERAYHTANASGFAVVEILETLDENGEIMDDTTF